MTLEDIRTTTFDEAQAITKHVKAAQQQALDDIGHAIALSVHTDGRQELAARAGCLQAWSDLIGALEDALATARTTQERLGAAR